MLTPGIIIFLRSSGNNGLGILFGGLAQVHFVSENIVPTELYSLICVVCWAGGKGSGKELVNMTLRERQRAVTT